MLIARQEEERTRLRQHMLSEQDQHRFQMQNMMAANMRQAEQERIAFMRERNVLEQRFLEVQKSNEENMEIILKSLSELIAQQGRGENLLTEMNDKRNEDDRALIGKASEMKDPGRDEQTAEKTCGKNEDELLQLMNGRNERVAGLKQRKEDIDQEQAEVEKPSYLKKALKIFATLAPVVGEVAAVACPSAKPIVMVAGVAANVLSDDCSIM